MMNPTATRASGRVCCAVLLALSLPALGCVTHFAPHVLRCEGTFLVDGDGVERGGGISAGSVDPWMRLQLFQECRDEAWNYDPTPLPGARALLHPTHRAIKASRDYVRIAEDFERERELGGASRAYWGALGLVLKARASRPDRERVRWAAFAGLQRIAALRGQPRWSSLLELCAGLASTYLGSAEAQRDETGFAVSFTTVLDREIESRRAAEDAKSASNWQVLGALANAGLQAGAAAAQGKNLSLSEQAQLAGEVGTAAKAGQKRERAAMEALAAVLTKIDDAGRRLSAAVADDVAEVEAGGSFVGEQARFYLEVSAEPAPYLAVLGRLAARGEVGELTELLTEAPKNARPSDEWLGRLSKAMLQLEVAATRFERAKARAVEPSATPFIPASPLGPVPPPPPSARQRAELGAAAKREAADTSARQLTVGTTTSTETTETATPSPITPLTPLTRASRAEPTAPVAPAAPAPATPGLPMALRIELAKAAALIRAGSADDALRILDPILASRPSLSPALRARADAHLALAGPGSSLAALATKKPGVPYSKIAGHLLAAVDDLIEVSKQADTTDVDALLERIGELQARASLAQRNAKGGAR